MAGRDERRRFWAAIAVGLESEDAALEAGVPPAVGTRWFRKAGGIPPTMFGQSAKPLLGRYRAGHLALILPNFARGKPLPGSIGMYEFLGNGRWADHSRRGQGFFRLEERL